MSEELRKFSHIYQSAKLYGCDEIIKDKLSLPADCLLPITIPHGVDTYQLKVDLDINCHEPVYMAFRDDIASRVSQKKKVIKFPHPWMFLLSDGVLEKGEGSLFIAPPPSKKNFEAMLPEIIAGNYPKPWGILMKERGLTEADVFWWESRGFSAHSAGLVSDSRFFYKLKDIIEKYSCVVTPYMSSAVVFAAAMNRRVFVLQDVELATVDTESYEKVCDLDDFGGNVVRVWGNLLSTDVVQAKAQAEELLGGKYMAPPEVLRDRLEEVFTKLGRQPVCLFGSNKGVMYRLCIWLIGHGVPMQRLFPGFFSKFFTRLASVFHLNRLTVIYGSDFAHYGVAGKAGRLQLRKCFAFSLDGASPGCGVSMEKKGSSRISGK